LKSKTQLPWPVLASVLLGLMVVLLCPGASSAGNASWWGSSAWWDWSDFRGAIGARVFLARLTSASVTKGGVDFDLKGSQYGFTNDPEPFGELWGVLYIDRLGLRFSADEHTFRGKIPVNITGPVSELEFSSSRLGLDLDLIRYPFFRFGIDYDYYMNELKFLDPLDRNGSPVTGIGTARYTGVPPMTLGFHARAIPVHIREVPFTVQARFRFPMPLVNRQSETKITDWEISGGLRPAVWETSLYGHATFSFDLEAGFRSVNLDANPETTVVNQDTTPDINLKARWQGAFFQIGLIF
jgi:hypothetical protein